MAKIIRVNGSTEEVTDLSFKNLYKLLDCDTIERLFLANGGEMYMDENGKTGDLDEKPYNETATKLTNGAGLQAGDYIVGDVMVCTEEEMTQWELQNNESESDFDKFTIVPAVEEKDSFRSRLEFHHIPYKASPDGKSFIFDLENVPSGVNVMDILNPIAGPKNSPEYLQVCSECGSSEVARCKWVNVNTSEVYYGKDSGTTLEWCMNCKDECEIITAEEFNAHTESIAKKEDLEYSLGTDNDLMTQQQQEHEYNLQQESEQEQREMEDME